jgi:hypothetical protein
LGEFVAGALAGAIMGLTTQAYWLIVLSHRTPAAFKRPESRLGVVILAGGLAAVGGFVLIGGLLGVLIGSVRPDETDAPLIPSAAFLLILVFLASFTLIIGLSLLHTWKRHILVTVLLFVGLFGVLLPNLIVAVQE